MRPIAPIDLGAPCSTCPHTRSEHQGKGAACIAIVEVHERQVYCPCLVFEPLNEAFA